MYMYTVNVFISEDSFTVSKTCSFSQWQNMSCDTGMACLYTASCNVSMCTF